MKTERLLRKLRARRENLIAQAARLDHQYRFASNAFKGDVAGPRIRSDLADHIDRIAKELDALDETLGIA